LVVEISKTQKYTDTDLRILQRDFPLGEYPHIFKLNITNICNYSCIMCPHDKITKQKGLMDPELFNTIVKRDILPGQYLELFNYGEPFLHPKLVEFCKTLQDKNVDTLISTNCSVGHDKLKGVLYNENVRLLACLESLDPVVYQRITGGRLDKVLQFIELARRYARFDDQVTILVVETQLNRGHSEEIREEYEDEFLVVRRLADSFGGNIPDSIVFDGEGDNPVQRVPCAFPFVNCAVDWDGKVGWCCYDYNTPKPYGDLNHQSLKEIWEGPVWTNLRRLHLSLNLDGTICKRCSSGWRDVLYERDLYYRLVDEDEKNYYYYTEDK